MSESVRTLRQPLSRKGAVRLLGWVMAGLLAFVSPGRADSEAAESLVAAVERGDLAGVRALLAKDVSPDSRDSRGVPVLALAVGKGEAEIVSALLARGADVKAKVRNEAEEMFDIPIVAFAAATGSGQTLRLLLQAGASPNEVDGTGASPLMRAASLGNLETIPVLLAAKAALEGRDRDNATPLMWAANSGQYEAARLLLDAGAAVNALGEIGSPPLIYAAQGGYDDVVALLVERGANPSLKTTTGFTALDTARENQHELTVHLLENGGRQVPPAPNFLSLRLTLFPEQPFEMIFLEAETGDAALEKAGALALKGDYRSAVQALLAADEAPNHRESRLWALAFLHGKLRDRPATLAVLQELLALPDLQPRGALRFWKLRRDLGESPPPDLAKRVLGVVVEKGVGPIIVSIAAFADGTPRIFESGGGGLIGDTWSETERAKARQVVRLAEDLVPELRASEDRELPRPGRTWVTVLTPAGTLRGEWSSIMNPEEARGKLALAVGELEELLIERLRKEQEDEE